MSTEKSKEDVPIIKASKKIKMFLRECIIRTTVIQG
jgi:hypothetical protein